MNNNFTVVTKGGDHNGLIVHEVTIHKGLDKIKSDSDVIQLIKSDSRIGHVEQIEAKGKDTWVVYALPA